MLRPFLKIDSLTLIQFYFPLAEKSPLCYSQGLIKDRRGVGGIPTERVRSAVPTLEPDPGNAGVGRLGKVANPSQFHFF
jgi:hypothetical protein